AAEQGVHEGRLTVVELADDDEVEPIGLELLDQVHVEPRRERLRAHAPSKRREVAERGDYVDLLVAERLEHRHWFSAPDLDEFVHLPVGLTHVQPAVADLGMLAVELALGKGAQRDDALRKPRMAGGELSVATGAFLALFVLIEERIHVERLVELGRAEG